MGENDVNGQEAPTCSDGPFFMLLVNSLPAPSKLTTRALFHLSHLENALNKGYPMSRAKEVALKRLRAHMERESREQSQAENSVAEPTPPGEVPPQSDTNDVNATLDLDDQPSTSKQARLSRAMSRASTTRRRRATPAVSTETSADRRRDRSPLRAAETCNEDSIDARVVASYRQENDATVENRPEGAPAADNSLPEADVPEDFYLPSSSTGRRPGRPRKVQPIDDACTTGTTGSGPPIFKIPQGTSTGRVKKAKNRRNKKRRGSKDKPSEPK